MRPLRSTGVHGAVPIRRTPMPFLAGLPVAVAGSIALSLTAVPAHADLRDADRSESAAHPLRGIRGVTPTVAPKALGLAASTGRVGTSEAAPATYTIQPGDTVSGVAERFGLRTADVLAINGLDWSSVIQPGQELRLTGDSAPVPGPQPTGAYTVQLGDTISAIASRHGLSVDTVLSANGLDRSSIIYPGQQIAIPGGEAIAPPSPAAPAPQPSPPAATSGGYTIAVGDTMSGIAQRHGVSVDSLLSANGLDRSSIIYPGQTIAIPLEAVPAAAPLASPAPTTVVGLDAEQTANAHLIVRIGRELGVPDRGLAIALATAMQESSLRNVTWGDRDSLGLFQQRPSTGWGTEAEVQDAERATRAFFGGPADPNGSHTRGLLDIAGWQDLGFAEAAQAVQISAFPDAYAQWEASAHAWLAAIG